MKFQFRLFLYNTPIRVLSLSRALSSFGSTELGKKMRVGRVEGMFGTDGLAVCAAPSSIDNPAVLGAASGSLRVSVMPVAVGNCAVTRLDTVIKENCESMVTTLRGVGTVVEISDGKSDGGRVNIIPRSKDVELAETLLAETAVGPAALKTVPDMATVLATDDGLGFPGPGVPTIVLSGLVGMGIELGGPEATTELVIAEGLLSLVTGNAGATALTIEVPGIVAVGDATWLATGTLGPMGIT